MFVVDTNVFVHAADTLCPEHQACLALLTQWRGQRTPWYTTWGIFHELLRVATHANVFRRPLTLAQAWAFVESMLKAPGLRVLEHTPRHAQVAAQTFAELATLRGNVVHDLHTAVLLREHGIKRIVTRDADFKRFPFLEVIDPLSKP